MWRAAWHRWLGITVVWAAVLGALLLPASGLAGAWMREPGTGFSTISGTFRTEQETARDAAILPSWDGKYYAEYGVKPWLTLGVDAYETGYTYGHVLIFGRVPLSPQKWRLKLAAEIGAGQYHDAAGSWFTMKKFTLSAGQGFEFNWSGTGWWAVDAILEQRPALLNDTTYKLEGTFGISPWERFNPMLKIETGHVPGDPLIWSITPFIRVPGKDGRVWLAGVEHRSVAGLSATGLKLETWWTF